MMALIMIILGTLTLVGLSIWLKSQQATGLLDSDNMTAHNEVPLILATQQGQLVHNNPRAQQLFNTDDIAPSLEHPTHH